MLKFTQNLNVPFTKDRGENDIRMIKVQQTILGCFTVMKVLEYSVECVVISTRHEHVMGSSQAMEFLLGANCRFFPR
ncbi:MAG: hypothetical protein HRT37_26185 [Alteromonadaceae bacterium]|nr:hypothetical protein [Alteromonadaceae bacterium]